ncbi:inhibitor of growth protein 1 [Nilaparvata lugens]|uniref:inhibitor of growth protein 1 n=1 Tax=Nilaparvata lugens TaxID=108931 RepID=UPI00193D150F|nr:inhibitor of growth protein 1 [Nilaparvata lugens]
MINQAGVEALYSATYVENYLDCVENLPDDLQRQLSRMRELDISYQAFLKEVESQQDALRNHSDNHLRRKALHRVQTALISAQEVGDEKLQLAQAVQDLIENKSRQLDIDYKNLVSFSDHGKEQENSEPVAKDTQQKENTTKEYEGSGGGGGGSGGGGGGGGGGGVGERERGERGGSGNSGGGGNSGSGGASEQRQNKRPRRSRVETDEVAVAPVAAEPALTPLPRISATVATKKGATVKKKKRKTKQTVQQREETPPREDEIPIDPDEPTYCLCDQISYGEMILCDNDLCPIEWFHFSCVALATKPKGKWYCPKCRGDRPNLMKPKAQFLKELERYNKEKEEKS